jgi:large conductance mechanosensitive channel
MFREFRDFIARGNVLDLAVAVIIGAAFATITTSLTDDIIMPIVGAIFGSVDFSGLYCTLDNVKCIVGTAKEYADLKAEGVPILAWGQFVTVVINFLILAFIIFLLVRYANRMTRKGEDAPAGPSEVELLTEIRDELRRK